MNIPLDEWSGSKATKELQRTIERNEAENAKQSRWMFVLTAAGTAFAFVAMVASVIQILPK
jgi:hypothetical protein